MKKEIYGRLSLSWGGNVILPLEEAHKIQAILARYGVGFGEAYRSNNPNITYITDYKAPDVTIVRFPEHDCTGMTPKQVSEWEEIVRTSEDGTFLPPQQYAAMRGENNG